MHENCKEGPKLDKETMTDRPRREEIVWTPIQTEALQKSQQIMDKLLIASIS